jgi:triosephosphate isomerase (TIM)
MSIPIIVGNWKMHKTIAEAVAFVKALEQRLIPEDRACLAVPFTALRACATHALRSRIGAQNMSDAAQGPFTGEISAPMLLEAGAQFVLLGHSERRHLFAEDEGLIRRKLERAIHQGIQPILCVGELLEQRRAGQTEAVVVRQLESALGELTDPGSLMIAYEPVWAIGTGETASCAQAVEMHQLIRRYLSRWNRPVPILYGGSVRPDNAAALLNESEVNGLLVGGASLELDSFLSIVEQGRRG